ncbi:uncharacterized protein I303_100280 [Kwoniella dejecticola CBS 10117]|uniref:AAA+ ATPase domain-containing protein n=1 Tax=Kwoniella dejecticola CBS 10117 TaxID=1296121 RepID=A0A1A6AEJ2_9TREE|nr:uncharacterized protein I303_00281 [Kwoniella dejecticola CBS 10117]OBR88464.1 hypothetical protein I303_00281 [Kwoniella dejecticola CBS 10117]
MSSPYPNPNSASSIPYNTYPNQPNNRPPQPIYNSEYAYQSHPQQGTGVHISADGGGPPFPNHQNHQYYTQQPGVINAYNSPSQPVYPDPYSTYTQPDTYRQTYSQQSHSFSPQAHFLQSPQHQQQIPFHQSPTQFSGIPGHSASPVFPSLSPQATYPQPSISPVSGGIDTSLVWSQSIPQQPLPSAAPVQQQVPKPANIPAAEPIPSAAPSKSPLKIRLKIGSRSTSQDTEMAGRSHRHAAVEEESYGTRPRRGASQRAQAQMVSYKEEEEDDDFEDAEGEDEGDAEGEAEDGAPEYAPEIPIQTIKATRSSRTIKAPERYGNEDAFEDKLMPSSPPEIIETRRTSGRTRRVVVDPDEDEDDGDFKPAPRNAFPARTTRTPIGSAHAVPVDVPTAGPSYSNGNAKSSRRTTRQSSRVRHSSADAEEFEPTDDGSVSDDHVSSDDPLGNYGQEEEEDEDDLISRSSQESPRKRKTRRSGRNINTRSMPTRRSTRSARKKADQDSDDEYGGGGKRNLRTRTSKPNYHIPTLDDLSKEISMAEAMAAASRPNGRPGGVGGLSTGVRFGAGGGKKGMPWSVKGRDLAQAMGDPDTSDSDDFITPLKSAGAAAGASMTGAGPVQRTNAVGPSDVPNYGRINPKSNMADADPMGVDMNVTFDNVGGLDDHINQLKEMVALPLLYPELFQQFGITPPRGVLFHGPPGTGKTLLARALAASCSTGNTKIAFFMRKGADVLSKWVGEAERQLRMLFEEARACQPSIIFFDEIDGIAPVRSSKQDQIHASLVSTLLALMDGMDGRGQVIVIGATNRPDAVDPALRRPGRFDREFYFPLPNRAARKKIIQINTKKWDPQLSDEFLDKLAQLTKGYGGADLRALCTETALNAIQRRYPQIYKTADRLQLETKSIHVSAKDFMMSIKKIVPSSARSTSSAAVQLPPHLIPLLSAPLARIRTAIDHVLPPRKQATALEEAEWEEEEGDSFEKHMMLQSLDKLRTFKPRILVHGNSGMGQTYLGPAILHHLEGFHVQSFDLGTLMGDSTRSVEAAVVQLIIEAKRHQPSIIFVPSLSTWSTTIADTARATIKTLLDGIAPSDPILVLGISDAPIDELPLDVRGLFGFGPENRIGLELPTQSERTAYFSDLLAAIHRPPTEFPDGIPRKKRVFEVLPLAAPLPPRQPTAAELLREEEKDQAARDMLFHSFVNLVRDFLKRHRKVVASIKDDAIAYSNYLAEQAAVAANQSAPTLPLPVDGNDPEVAAIIPAADGDVAMAIDPIAPPTITVNGSALPPTVNSDLASAQSSEVVPAAINSAPAEVWQAHPIDVDTLQIKLLKHKYYTPSDFLEDIAKIEENATKLGDPDRMSRVQEMASSARYHVQGFDQKWIPEFERYKQRVLAKKAEKQKKKAEAEAEAEAAKEKAKETPSEAKPPNGNDAAPSESSTGEASGLKRTRDVEGESEDVNDEVQGREKRIREGGMEIEDTQLDDSQQIANSISATLLGGSEAIPTESTSSSTSVAKPTIVPSVPAPSYPPFDVPEDALVELKHDLDSISGTLNIDQLEQLRASLFDIVWRGRTEWDRKRMIEHMRSRVVEWGREVEKWKEGGRW